MLHIPISIDYHPIDNSGFRLSADLSYSNNQVDIKLEGNKPTYEINDVIYSAAQVGNVKGKLYNSNKIAPLASIGYDSSFIGDGPFSFNCELGAIYTGKYKVKASSSGLLKDNKTFQENLDKEVDQIRKNDTLNKIVVHPIISLGLKYSF